MPVAHADDPTPNSEAEARGAERVTLSGTPIVGGDALSPTELTVGDWQDTLSVDPDSGSEATLYYTLKRAAGAKSTLRVTALAMGSSEGSASVSVTAVPSDDPDTLEFCPDDDGMSTGSVGIATASIRLAPSDECGTHASYRIEVAGDPPGDAAIPVMVRVTEEPEVTSNGASGTVLNSLGVPPSATGPVHDVEGALSFSEIPALREGRWASSLVPSETRLYRIPLDYGQSVRVGTTFKPLTAGQREALGSDSASISTSIELLDPMLGRLPVPEGAEDSDSSGTTTLFTGTGTVNRGIESDITGGSTQLAGDYYLAVTVPNESGASVVLPFTIDLAILGEPDDGPTWADGADWSLAGQVTPVSGGEAAGAEEEKDAKSSSAAARTWSDRAPSIASGVAGLVFTTVGVVMLARLRRPGTANGR